jgi:hypothetical protein
MHFNFSVPESTLDEMMNSIERFIAQYNRMAYGDEFEGPLRERISLRIESYNACIMIMYDKEIHGPMLFSQIELVTMVDGTMEIRNEGMDARITGLTDFEAIRAQILDPNSQWKDL